ncbi:MAG: DUF1294 domain-containing protein [Eubacteriales bacterium]
MVIYMDVPIFLLGYVGMVNLIGFFGMGIDKHKAQNHQWRIPESTLFTIALIGGCLGTIIGMYTFRHKTKHSTFVFGLPIIMLLHLAFLFWVTQVSPYDFYFI